MQSQAMAGSITVDIRDYITQDTPGFHLRSATETVPGGDYQRIDGQWIEANGTKEFLYSYSNGILDYIGRASYGSLAVGSIRNRTETINEVYRCFSNTGESCQAPSITQYPPQAVPMIFITNSVPTSYITQSEGVNGTPETTIPGAISFYGWQEFGVNEFDSSQSCAQTYVGAISTITFAVVADSINFGGDIGVQNDVLIIDEIQMGGGTKHIERYFYAKGYGRIREASAWDNNNDDIFDEAPFINSTRNIIVSSDFDSSGGIWCYQGGNPFN